MKHGTVKAASSWHTQVSSLKSQGYAGLDSRVLSLDSKPTAIVAPTNILIRLVGSKEDKTQSGGGPIRRVRVH